MPQQTGLTLLSRFRTGYRLSNKEIIAASVMENFSLQDWRFLFWLTDLAAAGAEPTELLELVWADNADQPPGAPRAPDEILDPAAYRMAVDIIQRALAMRHATANHDHDGLMTIGEAAAMRGVSRQAITQLIATNRVDYVRNGRTVLIRRQSVDALPAHPRKRASGQQILVYGRPALEKLRAGDGVIHTLPRTVVSQAGIGSGFGYMVLHARARLNERDMDELASAGIELKGHEAFREWLAANARESDIGTARQPPLAGILRGGRVWRLNVAAPEAEQPIMARIFGHPDLEHTSGAVLHGIMLRKSCYLDVMLRDDADEKALAAFPVIAGAHCRWVRDAADLLSGENQATTWCKDLREEFAAVLGLAIAGPNTPEQVAKSVLFNPELFGLLLAIVEAGYMEFQGYAEQEHWIDFRRALKIRDGRADPTPRLPGKREFLDAVKIARRKTNGADFKGSLSEFYGLRLVAEQRDWTAAQIIELLPKLIRPTPWWQYERFTTQPPV
jgi:excisionase family DNA binding protein